MCWLSLIRMNLLLEQVTNRLLSHQILDDKNQNKNQDLPQSHLC